MDDITVSISERVLQHALSAFAAERFTYQHLRAPKLGLTAIGGDMRLALGHSNATISLTFHGAFHVKMGRWKLAEKHETLTVRIQGHFTVLDGALYMRLNEGNLEAQELAWLEKSASEAIQHMIRQLFQQPLLRLPIQLNVASSHAESSDESRLCLQNVVITPGALQITMRLEHDTVERPASLVMESTPVRSRTRAIMLCRRGIDELKAGNPRLAAALFYEAAFRADPSFETAWLWLAESVHTPGERRYCLERAFRIAPENLALKDALQCLGDVVLSAPGANTYRM